MLRRALPAAVAAAVAVRRSSCALADGESSSGMMEADSLERAARALREINNSPFSKKVFEVMQKQEDSRQLELEVQKAHHAAQQAMTEIETQRKFGEENRELVQQQAQVKAQAMRHEDELARERMKTEHAAQRKQDAELVRMQEESSIRKEQARRATEEQIQERLRQSEKHRAEIEQETIKVKAMAEAEGRAREAILSEEYNRRMMLENMRTERDKWLSAVNTTFGHIEGGFRVLLTDRSKLVMGIGGITALAAGVYTTREGAKVMWGYINRILGQPSLIRESSMSHIPFLKDISRINPFRSGSGLEGKSNFQNVILRPQLKRRIEQLAIATKHTKSHDAPFRNMLFYGPPGTGKTLVAKEMARKSGLDYAMMTGGDVAPLGSEAVTKIHQIFDWAKKSREGLLLFIDEADAFLCERNSVHMSEAQRSALNALLFRTGDQSRDIVLVLATNRPGDLDAAVTDRIDEVIQFPLPGPDERYQLLKLYLNQYILQEEAAAEKQSPWQQKIAVRDITDDLLREAAKRLEGFSGREIAKLMAGVQAAVYGSPDCTLDADLFKEIVEYKVTEHHQRIKLTGDAAKQQS